MSDTATVTISLDQQRAWDRLMGWLLAPPDEAEEAEEETDSLECESA